jgi:thiol-disulfide isomerase/thioredoxin
VVWLLSSKKKSPEKHSGLSKAEKAGIPILILIVLWVMYSLTQPSLPIQSQSHSSTSTMLTRAEEFKLPVIGPNGLTGQSVSLSSYRGKIILLEIMQPSCQHCQNVAPVLERFYKQHGADVVILSIAAGAPADDVAKFIRDYDSHWTYLYDSAGSMATMYGVTGTPTFFVIGRDGSIITSLQGQQNYETFESVLAQASRT